MGIDLLALLLPSRRRRMVATTPFPDYLFEIKPGKQLLTEGENRGLYLDMHRTAVEVTTSVYNAQFLPVFEFVAEYVQILPGSQIDHHSRGGGLLDHLIEVVALSARHLSSLNIDRSLTPGKVKDRKRQWQLALMYLGFVHDLLKPQVGFTVRGYRGASSARDIQPWPGRSQSIYDWAREHRLTHFAFRHEPTEIQGHVAGIPQKLGELLMRFNPCLDPDIEDALSLAAVTLASKRLASEEGTQPTRSPAEILLAVHCRADRQSCTNDRAMSVNDSPYASDPIRHAMCSLVVDGHWNISECTSPVFFSDRAVVIEVEQGLRDLFSRLKETGGLERINAPSKKILKAKLLSSGLVSRHIHKLDPKNDGNLVEVFTATVGVAREMYEENLRVINTPLWNPPEPPVSSRAPRHRMLPEHQRPGPIDPSVSDASAAAPPPSPSIRELGEVDLLQTVGVAQRTEDGCTPPGSGEGQDAPPSTPAFYTGAEETTVSDAVPDHESGLEAPPMVESAPSDEQRTSDPAAPAGAELRFSGSDRIDAFLHALRKSIGLPEGSPASALGYVADTPDGIRVSRGRIREWVQAAYDDDKDSGYGELLRELRASDGLISRESKKSLFVRVALEPTPAGSQAAESVPVGLGPTEEQLELSIPHCARSILAERLSAHGVESEILLDFLTYAVERQMSPGIEAPAIGGVPLRISKETLMGFLRGSTAPPTRAPCRLAHLGAPLAEFGLIAQRPKYAARLTLQAPFDHLLSEVLAELSEGAETQHD